MWSGSFNILSVLASCVCIGYAISIDNNVTNHDLRPPTIRDNKTEAFENSELHHPSNIVGSNQHHHGAAHHIHLASWRWTEYGRILIPTIILVLAGIIKLIFHHTPILSRYMPESCVLIISGIFIGAFVYARKVEEHEAIQEYFPRFTSTIFFLVLLPPIILDAAYSIYNRHFLDNLGGVLVFAVVGTLFNAFCIGYGLYLINYLGWMGELPYMDTIASLKFAALISAVDPVAVLAIFQEIGVNISLYFMVFGESLLNDGVSIVLYNSMGSLGDIQASSVDGSVDKINYLLAILSFFTVVFGGLVVGICIGLLTSFIVKFTEHTQVIEPFLILAMSYFSYVLAETFHWSGIISLIGCGIAQKRYAFLNISKTSLNTVKHAVKTLATFSDCVIFLFLGVVTISRPNDLKWHWGFSLWTCFLCLIIRFAGVFLLSSILNIKRLKKISIKEQIIIAYGGLRGAVGFSLAIIYSQEDKGELSKIFLTTTLFMVFFTVFLQGGTIKFLVEKLNIKREDEKVRLISDDVNSKTIDLLMSGIGSVLGEMSYTAALENLQSLDRKFIKKWLIRDNVVDAMTEKLNKISLEEHYARLYGPSLLAHQDKLGGLLKSIIPDKDTLKLAMPGIGLLHNHIEGVPTDNGCHQYEDKEYRDAPHTLANVVMDKIMLNRAFLDSSYERTKRAEYANMHIAGSLKASNSAEHSLEDMLKQRQKTTQLIWHSAFSQVSLHHRKKNGLQPTQNERSNNRLNPIVMDDQGETCHVKMRWKRAYQHAKEEFKSQK